MRTSTCATLCVVALLISVAPGEAEDAPPEPGIELEVQFVDALSGEALRVAWGLRGTDLSRQRALRIRHDGQKGWPEFDWRVPKGYVDPVRSLELPTHPHPLAKRLMCVVPLWPEVPLHVTVREASGARAKRVALALTGIHEPFTFLLPIDPIAGNADVLRARRLPLAPGAPVTLFVGRWTGNGNEAKGVTWSGSLPEKRGEKLVVDVTLPTDGGEEILDGDAGQIRIERLSGLSDAPFIPSRKPGTIGVGGGPRRFPVVDLKLRVKGRDGATLPGVCVERVLEGGMPPQRWMSFARVVADEKGLVTLPKFDTQHDFAELREPGFVITRRAYRRKLGPDEVVELREAAGELVEVQVLGPSGKPAPFAKVSVAFESGFPFVDLASGTQQVDAYTDHEGKRTLRLGGERVTIEASWFGALGEQRIDPQEGATRKVTIEVQGDP